jgi:hypothetical protein
LFADKKRSVDDRDRDQGRSGTSVARPDGMEADREICEADKETDERPAELASLDRGLKSDESKGAWLVREDFVVERERFVRDKDAHERRTGTNVAHSREIERDNGRIDGDGQRIERDKRSSEPRAARVRLESRRCLGDLDSCHARVSPCRR